MKRTLVTLVLIALAYFILRLLPGYPQLPEISYFKNSQLSVIAHRGGRGLRPGNTIEAALNAIQIGADVIEIDVHLTADGILVVRHDDVIDTTTTGSGRISEMDITDIQLHEVGFHEFDFPDAKVLEDIRVPTLESMFKELPDERYLIELKPNNQNTADALCKLVTDYGLQESVIVGSFHSSALKYFRETCPAIPTSMGQSEMTVLVLLERLQLGHLFKSSSYSIQVPISYGGIKILSPSLVELAHKLNMRVDVWTVNDTDSMRHIIDMGVDGVITDYPDRLLSILGK